MIVFFIVFFSLYTLINSYIFLRSWQALALIPQLRIPYTIIFLIAFSSYFIARIFSTSLPEFLYTIFIWIGSIYFFFLTYFFFLFLIGDIIRIINSFIPIIPKVVTDNFIKFKFFLFIFLILFVSGSAFYGFIHRSTVKIKNLTIQTSNSKNKSYRIVFFSDLHISVVNNHNFLESIVEKINAQEPDLILIGGDLVDESPTKLEKLNLVDQLKNLKSKYGIYSITGNHEYINGVEPTVRFLESMGIRFLRDELIKIDDAFYVIGREDRSKKGFTGIDRKNLAEIMKSVNEKLPTILLDHQPVNLDEAKEMNITLQLSGHTHHGQFFPLNLITKKVYEVSWGYKKKGNTHFYVSSGIGTWGPPIKIGNDAELIVIEFFV